MFLLVSAALVSSTPPVIHQEFVAGSAPEVYGMARGNASVVMRDKLTGIRTVHSSSRWSVCVISQSSRRTVLIMD